MLRAWGNNVLVFHELVFDVSRHEKQQLSLFVIPFQFYPTVEAARPIVNKLVFLLQALDEVLCVLFSDIFKTEVIHHKSECDLSPFMSLSSGSTRSIHGVQVGFGGAC